MTLNRFVVFGLAWLIVAAGPVGDTRTVLFDEEPLMLKGAALTKRGRAALASEANRLATGQVVTAIVCLDPKLTPKAPAAGRAAKAVRAALRASRPGLRISTVVREWAPDRCPAGVVLQIAALTPPAGRAEAIVAMAFEPVEAELDNGRVIPIVRGSVVPPGTTVKTGAGGRCEIVMPMGSRLRLRENTQLVLTQFGARGAPKRNVTMKVLAGRMWASVVKFVRGPSDWRVESINAVAGVRGTEFQMGVAVTEEAPATLLGVETGSMGMKAGDKEVEVPAGFSVSAVGEDVSDPKPLPSPPTGLRPVAGSFSGTGVLSWKSVDDVVAYTLELATDVQFSNVVFTQRTASLRLALSAPSGTYYWRVLSADEDGFDSVPSKLYRITFE